MSDEEDIPEGAAVLPEVPAELKVQPLLLALLHAVVFLAGSDDSIVQPEAGDEALDQMVKYLRRLDARAQADLRADLEKLAEFSRRERRGAQDEEFFRNFLADFGIGEEGERPE